MDVADRGNDSCCCEGDVYGTDDNKYDVVDECDGTWLYCQSEYNPHGDMMRWIENTE